MILIAPGHIEPVIYPDNPGVIAAVPLGNLRVITLEVDPLRLQIPVYAVLAPTDMQMALTVGVITSEHSGELAAKGHYCTVEDAVGTWDCVALYYRVIVVTPYDILATLGFILPGNAGQSRADYGRFTHYCFLSKLKTVYSDAAKFRRIV
jgi:hypothetical protein